jgi:26S proteasome regulatory subunit (ATPase 3-interacting protein)
MRTGTPLVSGAELDALDTEWTQWRAEWVRRRKVFYECALFGLLPFFCTRGGRTPTHVRATETDFLSLMKSFWALVSDPLPPPDAVQLAEDLGIEYDTREHLELERGPLCAPPRASRRR